jgi:hypothetical protein
VSPQELAHLVVTARGWAWDLEHDDGALQYLWQRRGISEHTAIDWGIGIRDIRRDGNGGIIGATWTLPVCAHTGTAPVVGIKLHRDPAPDGGAKCYWQPKGIAQHALLFPLLEAQTLPAGARVVLAPGELKALAYLDAGVPATSRTAGESARWPVELAVRFRNLRVVLDPDREESPAARAFVTNATAALRGIAASVEVCSQ